MPETYRDCCQLSTSTIGNKSSILLHLVGILSSRLTGLYHREGLLAPRPTTKLEDHLLSAVHDCLLNLFAANLHIGGHSSIRNLRTRNVVVTGTHYMAINNNNNNNNSCADCHEIWKPQPPGALEDMSRQVQGLHGLFYLYLYASFYPVFVYK